MFTLVKSFQIYIFENIKTRSVLQVEALRMKKKLEADVGDLENSLEHANAANMENQKSIKKMQDYIRKAQVKDWTRV